MTFGIDHGPAFNWWVPHVLRKRGWIISLVRKRTTHYLKQPHKFGIEVLDTVKEAFNLDCKAEWQQLQGQCYAQEMKEVCIAFKILPDGHVAPIGYQKIPCHMVFNAKMEDFRQKAQLIAGGHKTKAPATITYASVVSRKTVCLTLTIAVG
jgi:hypothetical protein